MADNQSNLAEAKKIKRHSIIGIVLFFTLIGVIVSLILALVDGVKIISKEWGNVEVDDDKLLWGLLTLIALHNIASLIFANKAIEIYNKQNQ